jgi:hypothetical protein
MIQLKYLGFVALLTVFLCGCLPSDKNNPGPTLPSDEELDSAYEQAVAEPKKFQSQLRESCTHFNRILLDVAETIQMGSRIWNAGGAPITIRLYEGAAYRVLYEIQYECPSLSHAFLGGLNRAAKQEGLNEKGFALRNTMDLVMGGAPARPPGQ